MIWWRGLRQVLCFCQASTGDIWSIYEKWRREENIVNIIHNFFCCHASSPFLLSTLTCNLCLLKTQRLIGYVYATLTLGPSMRLVSMTMSVMCSCQIILQWSTTVLTRGPETTLSLGQPFYNAYDGSIR